MLHVGASIPRSGHLLGKHLHICLHIILCIYIHSVPNSQSLTLVGRAKIYVFGPSHLPLVVAGSQPNFPLASLAEWDRYGMELRPGQAVSEANGESDEILSKF